MFFVENIMNLWDFATFGLEAFRLEAFELFGHFYYGDIWTIETNVGTHNTSL